MEFNRHDRLRGCHSVFNASQPHWLRYDDDKAIDIFLSRKAAEMGTKLHAWAEETIRLGIKQQQSKKTLCAYINDAIKLKMDVEQVLFYSERFFGTADAISFRNGMLRIHDLKTGKTPAHMEQLMVYAALFCLEYKFKPIDIRMELRIYQNDEVVYHEPEVDEIVPIMDKIVHLDKLLASEERLV